MPMVPEFRPSSVKPRRTISSPLPALIVMAFWPEASCIAPAVPAPSLTTLTALVMVSGP